MFGPGVRTIPRATIENARAEARLIIQPEFHATNRGIPAARGLVTRTSAQAFSGLTGVCLQSACDSDDRPGDIGRFGAEQPGDGGCDLQGFPGTSQRDAGGDPNCSFGVTGCGVDVGADNSRSNGVDPDTVLGQFLG
jgi:hypothetical protein